MEGTLAPVSDKPETDEVRFLTRAALSGVPQAEPLRSPDLPFGDTGAFARPDRGWGAESEGVPVGLPDLRNPEALPQTPDPSSEVPSDVPAHGALTAQHEQQLAALRLQLNDARNRTWIAGLAGLLLGAAVTAAWFG